MANIEEAIELDVSPAVAYQAWSRFETFSEFMPDIRRVEALDDRRFVWTGDIGFGPETWDVRVLEAIPDLLVSWESTSRRHAAATAAFSNLDGRCLMKLTMSYDPEGVPASEGRDHRQIMAARLQRDLRAFKAHVEGRARAQPGASA